MVDDLKQNFQSIIFDQIPRAQNKAVTTIGSLLDIELDIRKYKFLVE